MATADWTPSVADVANLLFARARGRFTGGDASVNPMTFDQPDRVAAIIAIAAGLVAPQLGGDDLDEQFWPAGKGLICLKTALLLEPGAWPEQAKLDKSAYDQWQAQYELDMPAVTKAIIRFADDGDDGPGSTVAPIGSFPPPGIPDRLGCWPWATPFPFGFRGEDW